MRSQQRVGWCTAPDGARIVYATIGDGLPVVRVATWLNHLEHDWDSPLWGHLLRGLADGTRLVRYDHRGVGLSQRTVTDFGLDALVGDLAAVVDSLCLERFSLLALSFAGPVAIEYAARHPARVDGLALLGCAPRGWRHDTDGAAIERHRRLLAALPAGWGHDSAELRTAWSGCLVPLCEAAELDAWLGRQQALTDGATAAAIYDALGDVDVTGRLGQLTLPVLVAHSRRDPAIAFEQGRELARAIHGARLLSLESARHVVFEDEPAWPVMWRELAAFLGAAAAAPGDRREHVGDGLARFLVTGGAQHADLDPEPPVPDSLVGRLVDRYQLVERLGQGGMGVVYRAIDTRLSRPVAIKLLLAHRASDPEAIERFELEARAVSRLAHPGISVLHEIGDLDGSPYLVLELLEGTPLDVLLAGGPLPVERALRIAAAAADALEAAHEAGVIHRDIKPANLFLTRHDHVKILDFGIAKLGPRPVDDGFDAATSDDQLSLTRPGVTVGTIAFMSPEQVRDAELDGRSDVFSLGAVLYEMLAGRRAFGGSSVAATVDAVLHLEPPSLTEIGIDAGVATIVNRALAKQRDERWASAAALRDALEEARQALRSGTASATPAATLPGWRRARYLGVAVLAVLVILGLLLVFRPWTAAAPPSATTPARAVAVLPFEDLSAEPIDPYLTTSLPDEITNALTRAHDLAVRPFSESRRLDPATTEVSKIAAALGADHLVTGQLYRHDDALRLTLEAVDAAASRIVWRESLELPADDLLALRARLAERVQEGLLPALGVTPGEPGSVPTSADAYRLYLETLPMLVDPDPNRAAIAQLERSLELDPAFAPAWSELGRRLHNDAYYWRGGAEHLARARAAVERALELDPDLLDAAGALVELQVTDGAVLPSWQLARRLVAHRPATGYVHVLEAVALRYGGLIEEARAACERAIALDSQDPRLRGCVWVFLWTGDLERAAELAARSSSLMWHNDISARIALMRGHRDEARRLWSRQIGPGAGQLRRDAVVACLEGAPQAEIAEHFALQTASLRSVHDPEWKFLEAGLFAYCGRRADSLALLRDAVDGGYCVDPSPAVDPLLAPISADPALAELQRSAADCRARIRRAIADPPAD